MHEMPFKCAHKEGEVAAKLALHANSITLHKLAVP